MELHDLFKLANQHPSRTAQAAGIARSTLLRVSNGQTQPSLETLQELALVFGLEAKLSIAPASDSTVTFATRYLLDTSIPEPAPEVLENISRWADRFGRWGIETPEDMVAKAGELSNLSARQEAVFFASKPTMTIHETALLVASAAENTNADWALSGQAAANRLLGTENKGPIVLWAENPAEAAHQLGQTLTRRNEFSPTGVVLLPAKNGETIGSHADKQVFYAADLQAVIDLHSLGFAVTAQQITKDWS